MKSLSLHIFLLPFLCLLLACQDTPAPTTTNYPIMGDLEIGDHPVGYKTLFLYDQSRNGIPYSDWDGRLYDDFDVTKGRQYQVNIWYPANDNGTGKMTYQDYVNLMGRQTNFEDSPEQRSFVRKRFVTQANALGGNGRFTANSLDSLLSLEVISRQDATPQSGKFPVILYPNGSSPAYQSITGEYLASHGYVVVGFVMKGRFSSGLEVSTIELETAADDLAYVMDQVGELSFTNMDQVALMANAISSSVCAVAVAHNDKIKAYVSLDGGILSAFEQRLLKPIAAYSPDQLRVPILFVYAPHPSIDPQYTYDLVHAPRYYAHFPTMSEFAMLNFGMFNSFIPDIIGAEKGSQRGYEIANELVLRFFDAHLKQEDLELFDRAFMDKAAGLIDTTFFLPSIPAPPNIAILKNAFITRGMSAIDSTYRDLKQRGNTQPFSLDFYSAFRDWLAWKKDPDYIARRAIYEHAVDSYPNSAKANYNLAYYLQLTGANESAIELYNKSISLIEDGGDVALSAKEKDDILRYSAMGLSEIRDQK